MDDDPKVAIGSEKLNVAKIRLGQHDCRIKHAPESGR